MKRGQKLPGRRRGKEAFAPNQLRDNRRAAEQENKAPASERTGADVSAAPLPPGQH